MLGDGDDVRWDMKFKRDATAASFRFANIGCSQLSCGIQNVVDEFIQHLNQPVGCKNDGIITVLSCLQLRHVNVNHSNKVANDIPLTKFPDTNNFPAAVDRSAAPSEHHSDWSKRPNDTRMGRPSMHQRRPHWGR